MKRLLLISNGRLAGQGYLAYALSWISAFFDSSPEKRRTLLFFPFALKDHDVYHKTTCEALAPIGINLLSMHNMSRWPDSIDGLFVGGGNTFRLLAELQRRNLLEVMREKSLSGLPYMGVSAGINIAGPTIKTTNDMPIVQPASFEALGLVSFQLNPHYVEGKIFHQEGEAMVPHNGESRAQRIEEYLEENETPVLALREGTALRVEGNDFELVGDKNALYFSPGREPLELQGRITNQLGEREKQSLCS